MKQLTRINSAVLTLLCVCLALAASSCGRDGRGADKPVSWPELARFDELAHRAEGLARVGDLAGVRDSHAELLAAGKALTPATVPHNVADPQQVETILKDDLTSLVKGLSAKELDDESLTALVLGLHPVIEKLITAAGVPHIHANEGPNDGLHHPHVHHENCQ